MQRVIKWLISLVAITGIAIHYHFPEFKLDAITISLAAIAILPWLATLLRSVEIPGAFKIEFQDLQKIEKRAEESGLITSKKASENIGENKKYSFEMIAGDDPNLALAGLRIEMESRLRELARIYGVASIKRGLGYLTSDLQKAKVISAEEMSAINDLLPLLNSAAHGAEVDVDGFSWALTFGPKILAALESKVGKISISNLITRWEVRDGAAVAEVGGELSKAFVENPVLFLTEMKLSKENFSSWLNDLPHHTFTIFEARSDLDNELYYAYYEKLRKMMIDAANSVEDREYVELANQIIEALKGVNITCID